MHSLANTTHTAPAVAVDTQKLIAASVAPNTAKAYSAALSRLSDALGGQSPTDASLADYLAQGHASGLSPATLAVVVQAVRFVEKLDGRPSIVGPLTTRTLAGIRREGKGRGRGQVAALRYVDVEIITRDAAKLGTLAGLRDAALFRVMSDGMLRISETVAIDVQHLDFEADGTGRLTVPSSKTDQEGQGAVLFLGQPTVAAIRAYLEAAVFSAGALFRRMRRGDRLGQERITDNGARLAIKAAAVAAGVEGASGHSLRIGTAQDLAQAGASTTELMQAGRWETARMPAHYVRGQAAAQGAIARHRYRE